MFRGKWFVILAIVIPFLFIFKPLLQGHTAFWYDPARDLLLAWDNLTKPTLIGPTTGIPGVFYGPFWIWLLSIGVMISKDPRVITFIVATLPYFIVFPSILWKLSDKVFNKNVAVSLWLLFILTFPGYSIQLWSPHPAPLLYLILFYLVITTDLTGGTQVPLRLFMTGVVTALFLSFLFSLGMVLPIVFCIYFLTKFFLEILRKKVNLWNTVRKWVVLMMSFVSGIVIIITPFLLFEYRHGFNQLQTLVGNINQGALGDTHLNGNAGLDKWSAVEVFISQMAQLVHLPAVIFLLSILLSIVYIGYQIRKGKIKLAPYEINLLVFAFANCVGILLGYFISKNPIWSYRFIGMEIISLFIVGFIAKKILIVEKFLLIGGLILLTVSTFTFMKSVMYPNKIDYDLGVQKNIVESILKDAENKEFVYIAKNRAIYSYDYDYLFRWLKGSENNLENAKLVYVIIPKSELNDKVGFTKNRTPDTQYQTTKEWYGRDGSLVIRREIKQL